MVKKKQLSGSQKAPRPKRLLDRMEYGRSKIHDQQKAAKKSNQQAFLKAYRIIGTVSLACESAGIAVRTHYFWNSTDKEYAEEFAEAREYVSDMLEAEAIRRATAGVQRRVLYRGEQVMVKDEKTGKLTPLIEHQHSDTLLIFLLKGNRPEKFRDQFDVNVTSEAINAAINAELAAVADKGQGASITKTTRKPGRIKRRGG